MLAEKGIKMIFRFDGDFFTPKRLTAKTKMLSKFDSKDNKKEKLADTSISMYLKGKLILPDNEVEAALGVLQNPLGNSCLFKHVLIPCRDYDKGFDSKSKQMYGIMDDVGVTDYRNKEHYGVMD